MLNEFFKKIRRKALLSVRDGDVGLAAEGTNRPVVQVRPAVGATFFQDFAADRAETTEYWIALFTVRTREFSAVNFVFSIGRAMGIGTETPSRHRGRQIQIRLVSRRRFLRGEFQSKFRGNLPDRFVVQFSAVAALEHGKSRLLAADFESEFALRNSLFAPGIPCLEAEFFAKICHGAYYPLFQPS